MIRTIACVVAAALLVAGCSSKDDREPSGGKRSTSSSPSSARSLDTSAPSAQALFPEPTGTWTCYRDEVTGVAFDMPSGATEETDPQPVTNGIATEQRLWQWGLQGGGVHGGVSIGVVSGKGVTASFEGTVDRYPEAWKAQFGASLPPDFQLLERQPTVYQGHKAIDFRIFFTSTGPGHPKAVWFIRAVEAKTFLVIAQTIGFDTASGAEIEAGRALQARLKRGVRLAGGCPAGGSVG